jgi:type I restriction enzyme S subunit
MMAVGGVVNNLNSDMVRKVQVPIPSIQEQSGIADFLDKVSIVIEQRKEELQKLDDLIKARFVEMFGTLERPAQEFTKEVLKNLCSKITDGKHGGCTQEDGTGRYFVGAREIYDDAIHYDTAPQIKIEEFEKDYKRCNVEKGDFVIVNTGATIGKSAIATDDRTECTLLQKSVALLKVKRFVLHPVFLKYCYIVNDKMYRVESASAQPNLLLSKINATEIYVPPMSLQEQFASFVAQIDKSKAVVQKSLDKMQLLFDSLMQQYFG